MAIVIPDLSGLSQGISTAGGALAQALEQRGQNRLMQQQKMQQQKGLEAVTDWASQYDPNKSPTENLGSLTSVLQQRNIDPSIAQPIIQDILKKSISQQGDQFAASQVLGQRGQPQEPMQQAQQSPTDRMSEFSVQDLVTLSANPNKIVSQSAKSEIEKRKIDQKVAESDRKYHTQFAAKQEEKIANLREAIPKKRAALRNARSAVESGQVGSFGVNHLADATGIEAFRTVKGNQLITAGKENLLSNMSRVSAKGQNQWFEQRLASMFPKIGTSKEANLAIQEMLEGELVMEDAYLQKFDELAEQDEKIYGYAKKDLDRRARQAVAPLEELSFDRSAYRMRKLEEAESGRPQMLKNLMKKVPKGTPMTLEMGALFMNRFKDKNLALENAKKLGYKIPNGEDLRLYLMSNEEFSERIRGL